MKTKANIDKESQKRILELSNEELIKVGFIESPKYREEFVELAKVEVKKRDWLRSQLNIVQIVDII